VLVQKFVQLQVEALHRQLGVFSGGLVHPRRGHLFQQFHIKVAERVFHMVPYGRVGIDAAFINGTHVCQLIELLLLIVPQEEVAAALLFVGRWTSAVVELHVVSLLGEGLVVLVQLVQLVCFQLFV